MTAFTILSLGSNLFLMGSASIAGSGPVTVCTRTARYAKLVAVFLVYGATVHIGNIAGLSGTPWLATSLLWRCMDIALLIFDVVAAVSLWKGLGWSVWFVFSGIILLQFVPYTLLRSHFILKPEDAQTLNGLLGIEAILLALFLILLLAKK